MFQLKGLFKLKRLALAVAMSFMSEGAIAQVMESPAARLETAPRELHFLSEDLKGVRTNIPSLPYLVETAKDVVKLRCMHGLLVAFASEEETVYYCTNGWSGPNTRQSTIRFDRSPSELPYLHLGPGGLGVTLGCDLGNLQRPYGDARFEFACRPA